VIACVAALPIWVAQAAPTDVATLVQTIHTPSAYAFPEPHGITYLSTRPRPRLLLSDANVNETPGYPGYNVVEITLTGGLVGTWETLGFSHEPTGLSFNPVNGHLFSSDDDWTKVYEVDPGPDAQYGTPDDVVNPIRTETFGCLDPEGVAYDTETGDLFLADGTAAEVYRVSAGSNGFDGVPPAGDDVVTSFDTAILGASDPEGIAYDPYRGTLLIANRGTFELLEVTRDGVLVRIIDISATGNPYSAGVVLAPASNEDRINIYLTNRSADAIFELKDSYRRLRTVPVSGEANALYWLLALGLAALLLRETSLQGARGAVRSKG
jgi:hypothetical protein